MPERKRIAVVGTGVAGLTCAHLLSEEHEVTVFESADTLGMDSASKTVAGARMDVPLRTFSEDYYPNLTALYRKLGVEFSHANYEFACFQKENGEQYFSFLNFYRNPVVQRLFGYDMISVPRIFTLNPIKVIRYFSLLSEYYFFQKRGPDDLANGNCVDKTFKEYVLENHSLRFYEELLLPMLSVICTCSWEAVGAYPAEIIMDYLTGRSKEHPLGSTTLRATSGTAETVKRLASNFSRVFTGAQVIKVVPAKSNSDNSLPSVSWRINSSAEVFTEEFDHVIIATQANAALSFLEATPEQRKALSGVKYEKSRTLLHTDESMIPKGFAGTCSLSVRNNTESDCTIWMNKIDALLGRELERNVFQTWNPLHEPKEKPIVDVIFERPVVTLDSMKTLDLLAEINGRDGIWFIGAYSLYSMPLLENGARSAIRVANKLLEKKSPELGVQVSGESFAKRRPDLVTKSISRKKSRARMAVDGLVLSSYVAVALGTVSLVALPLVRILNRQA